MSMRALIANYIVFGAAASIMLVYRVMSAIIPDRKAEVTCHQIELVTADGVTLAGTWFLPKNAFAEPLAAVVIAAGGGIPAQRYHRLARFLATNGAAALTFDYRGIGASRKGSLRGLEACTEHWGVLDFGAALAAAKEKFPNQPLEAVAHSIGSLFIGAAPDSPHLVRVVFLGPHTGYFGDYHPRWRWLLGLTWHVMMPIVTRIVGYFPGRALGLGEDLPRGFALDWSGRRRHELLATAADRQRFGAILARYGQIRARTLAISVSDDAFAPPEAGRRLLSVYPSLAAVHEVITPTSVGRKRLGHFAFLRSNTAGLFWERTMAWLLLNEGGGRAGAESALSAGVPPSGTKEHALAGSATPHNALGHGSLGRVTSMPMGDR